ncbi:UPF0193 protein EVG1-like [Portunus trituberculatus]|uniref:UPF0193 protein EVG1-like n=1 Tax=Portunus trituberculatus TaxID=210409 RepID=UPI001E1CBA74|nr:UPF0193 protein EVG1-like [Portunus trituberculatus]
MAVTLRQAVAPGGVYDLPKVSYSDSTKLLIKELIKEASVSAQHQRQIERWVGGGLGLPPHRALTVPSQAPLPPSCQATPPRPHFQTKRSHEAIRKMGLYEPNKLYVPPQPKYGPGSKERCQELMAFGREGAGSHITTKKVPQHPATPSTPVDRFSELMREMEERVVWLESMEAVGAGQKYRGLIASQLALKLRDLELLDQERARDLAKAERQAAATKDHKE